MKQYNEHSDLDREAALQHILSGDQEKIHKAFLSLTYNDPDPDWVSEKIAKYVAHETPRVRASALHCLFLLSRNRGVLDQDKAYAAAVHNIDSDVVKVRDAAEELLYEVVRIGTSERSVPLSEIKAMITSGPDLQKLTATAKLFRYEDNREAVKEIGRLIMSQEPAVVRGWCLVGCRTFLIEDNDRIDADYARDLMRLAEQKKTPYISRMIADLEEWLSAIKK